MKLKKVIKKAAEAVFQSSWYPNKKIILESIPDLSCQTYPLFQYMLEQHLNDRYKIIWWVTDKKQYKDVRIKNVKFHSYTPNNIFEKLLRQYDLLTARAMLNSNRYIGKYFEKQFYFYLMHGACIKSRLMHTREDEVNESDGSICLSPFLRKYDVIEEHIAEERFYITGYPRNDYLFDGNADFCKKVLKEQYRSKNILWMPTFRKSKDGKRVDSFFDFPVGVPCLYSLCDCEMLNEALKKYDVTLIIKPHPLQDVTVIKNFNLSNIVFLSDDAIKKANVQLYQFLGATNALITDYSSVYYDYLLTGKKIGITVDDIDEYARTTGFVFEQPLDYLKGKYIKNTDDLISFVRHVAVEDDDMVDEREKISALIHTYKDSGSTKRVYDLIMQEISKRYER